MSERLVFVVFNFLFSIFVLVHMKHVHQIYPAIAIV